MQCKVWGALLLLLCLLLPASSHVCWGPPRQCLPGLRGEQIDQKKCQLDQTNPIVVTREQEDHSRPHFWPKLKTMSNSYDNSLE